MSYTTINFPTKKALRDALEEGQTIYCYNPVLGPNLMEFTGKVYLEGPHYPKPHSWYVEAWLEDGVVVRIK